MRRKTVAMRENPSLIVTNGFAGLLDNAVQAGGILEFERMTPAGARTVYAGNLRVDDEDGTWAGFDLHGRPLRISRTSVPPTYFCSEAPSKLPPLWVVTRRWMPGTMRAVCLVGALSFGLILVLAGPGRPGSLMAWASLLAMYSAGMVMLAGAHHNRVVMIDQGWFSRWEGRFWTGLAFAGLALLVLLNT